MAGGPEPPNLPPMHDPADLAARSARELARRIGTDHHDVLVVLGTGLTGVAEELGAGEESLPLDTLPSFPPYTAGGHRAHGWSLRVGERQVLVFGGRCHLYEGIGPAEAVHPLRTGIAAGCTTVILTAAAGGIRADLATGSLMVVEDHLNLTGRSPAQRPRPRGHGRRLRAAVAGARAGEPGAGGHRRSRDARCLRPGRRTPVETPAEIRMLRTAGADVVGMSMALETIAARDAGAEVLGLALVTNPAATASSSTGIPAIAGVGAAAVPAVAAVVRHVVGSLR